MNLISCERCGTVIDTNRIPKKDHYDYDRDTFEGEEEFENNFYYDDGTFSQKIECPSCKERISIKDGDIV